MKAVRPVNIMKYMICFYKTDLYDLKKKSKTTSKSCIFKILNNLSGKACLRMQGVVQYHVTFQITSYEFMLHC